MNGTQDGLWRVLEEYCARGLLALHMPGHKRNTAQSPVLHLLGAQWDVTELEGLDNLHSAAGILRTSMQQAAALWGARRSFYLVNGSTCGILAAVRAAVPQGAAVAVVRGCHRSVYHALELCHLQAVYLEPAQINGIYGSVTAAQVRELLECYSQVRLLILTSPTYEGVISPIAEICREAHRHNVAVLVDEAHGAHLDLFGVFAGGAVRAGADVVVQSLHKTLPSLTQTAVLHCVTERICERELARQLTIFETSSPSYLLLASIDACVQQLYQEGEALMKHWHTRLAAFDQAVAGLRCLRVLCHGSDSVKNYPQIWGFDAGKLLIDAAHTGMTGRALAARLRCEHHIETEMAHGSMVLAMTSPYDVPNALMLLAEALCRIDAQATPYKRRTKPALTQPQRIWTTPLCIAQALQQACKPVAWSRACGEVSAEYVWAYPPGAPLLVPGERITSKLLDRVSALVKHETELCSTQGQMPQFIWVIEC